MSVSREDLSLKMWQLQEAVQRLRANVRTVHDTKCRLFSAAWRKVTPDLSTRPSAPCVPWMMPQRQGMVLLSQQGAGEARHRPAQGGP